MRSAPEFCCPRCKGPLIHGDEKYTCERCDAAFPIVLGVPDFRLFPDPYIDFEDDYRKGRVLADRAANTDFKGLVEYYWEITPEVSRDRAQRFIRHVDVLVERGIDHLDQIEAMTAADGFPPIASIIEIGCGTGGFLAAARRRSKDVIGVDIAFRWLIIARKRLEEEGVVAPLVCCCAEYLPFAADVADLVVGEAVLEHVKEQERVINEAHRVLRDRGGLFLVTPNRCSITPEPHVRVWGVGFLPRRWMNAYVKLVKGIPYRFIKVLSLVELKKLLAKGGFADHRISLAGAPTGQVALFSTWEKWQFMVYSMLTKTPLLRHVLYVFGPFYDVIGRAHKRGKE